MTIAKLLDLTVEPRGRLGGRVLTEALSASGGPIPTATERIVESKPGAQRLKTVLKTLSVGPHIYYTTAGFPGRTVGVDPN